MNFEWIPVTEKLPEPNKQVLLSYDNYVTKIVGAYHKDNEMWPIVEIGQYDDEDKKWYVGNETIYYPRAWMPLPEPYQYVNNGCRCVFCKKVITDGNIFPSVDEPEKGICFNCY